MNFPCGRLIVLWIVSSLWLSCGIHGYEHVSQRNAYDHEYLFAYPFPEHGLIAVEHNNLKVDGLEPLYQKSSNDEENEHQKDYLLDFHKTYKEGYPETEQKAYQKPYNQKAYSKGDLNLHDGSNSPLESQNVKIFHHGYLPFRQAYHPKGLTRPNQNDFYEKEFFSKDLGHEYEVPHKHYEDEKINIHQPPVYVPRIYGYSPLNKYVDDHHHGVPGYNPTSHTFKHQADGHDLYNTHGNDHFDLSKAYDISPFREKVLDHHSISGYKPSAHAFKYQAKGHNLHDAHHYSHFDFPTAHQFPAIKNKIPAYHSISGYKPTTHTFKHYAKGHNLYNTHDHSSFDLTKAHHQDLQTLLHDSHFSDHLKRGFGLGIFKPNAKDFPDLN